MVAMCARTIVCVGVPTTARLHLQAIVDSTLDDLANLLRGLRVRDSRWHRRYTEVVWLDMRELKQRVALERDIITHSAFEAFLHSGAGGVAHRKV
jgi:hypothetical protein